MVFSVFAGGVALSGSAAAVGNAGNINFESANPSSADKGETVNNQQLTFSTQFEDPGDGNDNTIWVELDENDFLSLSVNSASTNDSDGISSSATLVDGRDNDGADDTIKFDLSDPNGAVNFTTNSSITYSDSDNLSGTVHVTNESGDVISRTFPSLVPLASDSSSSGFSSPLPSGPTDNTPSSLVTPDSKQVIADLSFNTPGEIDNVTVNATGDTNGDISNSSIDSVKVEVYNGSTLVNDSSKSYDTHDTLVNVTNSTGVDRLLVEAKLSSAAAEGESIDANLTVRANPTATVATAGVQTVTSRTGFISGRVSDQNNNDIPNATVTVQNSTRGFEKNTTTNGQGDYTIEVPPGDYTVTAAKPGFASAPPKDAAVQENATTTANLVIRRLIFPASITVTPQSDTTFVNNQLTYTVTVRDQNGDRLGGVDVNASVDNSDITFVSATTAVTDSSGEATFTVTSSDVGSGKLTFEAINNSGSNPTATADARFTPRSGNGTVFGEVFEVGNDADHGLENAIVYAVNKDRFTRNSISVPTPNNASEVRFYRVIDNETGAVVDYDDYRVDNDGQNAGLTWVTIRQLNATNESVGSGFAVRTKQNNTGPIYATPLEAGNYTIQVSPNQSNASDARYATATDDPFTNISGASVRENLTVDFARFLQSQSGAKLVDSSDPDGKYLLDRLFADGQEGVEYTLVAQKAGYERDYVDPLVTADGAFFEPGEDENFDLRPRQVSADEVNITQVGLHPVASYDPSRIDEFSNKSDEFVQRVPRNGSVIDVVEVETLLDNGARINGTAEVSIEDRAAFNGTWLNASVISGTVVSYSPSIDQITVNTGADGVARLLLVPGSSSADLLTNKTAILNNDRSARDNTTVEFVGQINFGGAAISGIVTDTNDDPVQDSVAYAERFLFPTDASVVDPNFTAPNDQTRFTVSPTGGIAAAAVDDPTDTFEITRQTWNATSASWDDANSATVLRSDLTNYNFPKSDFPGVSVDISRSGFKLLDIVELGGGTDPDASYTLDPLPAVPTATPADSTDYRVRGVKLAAPNASATRFGTASVQPGSTDDANIALPIDVTPADLQVTSLSAPSSASAGSMITVSADITNIGGSLGTAQTVDFRVDLDGDSSLESGETLANTTVDVSAAATETVTFTIDTSPLAPGTYTHGVATGDDIGSATIDILGSAEFEVSGLSAPASAVQGEMVNVSATITNNGSTSDTQTIEFRAGGSVADSTSLTLNGGESQTVMFTLDTSGLAPGTYTHGVFSEDDNETASIDILAPAFFDITSTSVPDNVTQGDTLNVSAQITNTGGVSATKPVSFGLNGTNVSAGGSGEVDILFTFDTTGSMGPFISETQDNIVNFTNAVDASGADARYALVSFKDGTTLDQDYTDDVSQLQNAVNGLSASGGGFVPENSYGAISDGLNLSTRPGAQVVVIHITDAVSHYEGDGASESFSPEINVSDLTDRINSEGVSVVSVSPADPNSDTGPAGNTTRWVMEDLNDGEWVDLRSDDFGDLLEGKIADFITSKVSGTNVTLAPGASTTVSFSLSTDRLAPGTYEGVFSTPDANSSDSVTVDSDTDRCPALSDLVEGYDSDGDCAITLTELGQASADFANGNITLTELGRVSTAFANT